MPPKRRETERAKIRRDERAREKEKEMQEKARPLSDIEANLVKPRITSSGRLTR